ncbi:MAG: nitroreductase family protein [Prevotellaceae bacterium]|jgi:nitroreductase|nr:nitroreductase family protein [Prevotellaceae bacterium]
MKKNNIYQLTTLALCVVVVVLAYTNFSSDSAMEASNKAAVLETIHSRKSVRKYIDKPVSKDDLLTLVKAGMAAPSGKNEQPWAFVIVSEKARLDTMAERLPYAKMLRQAAAAIVVCGDMARLRNPEASLWVQDCSAATENILLAAEAIGLGAVWTAAYPYEDRMGVVRSVLNLPPTTIPLCVIPVGYPDGTEKPKDKWKEENVRWERWE